MNKKLIFTTLIIVLIILLSFLLFNSNIKLDNTATIPTDDHLSLGNPNAKVKVVAFEDLKCPGCAHYHNTMYPTIKNNYIDSNVIEYTDIILAFLPGSPIVGMSTYCVEEQNPDQFYPFISAIFTQDFGHDANSPSSVDLLNLASQIGDINIADLRECMNTRRTLSRLEDNMDLANEVMNGQVSTPSVYVNGQHVATLSEANLINMIEAELD